MALLGATVGCWTEDRGSVEHGVEFDDASNRLTYVHRSSSVGGDGLGGAAWFDYDNDLDLDLLLTNGKSQENGLFRNDGFGRFEDVAALAGIEGGEGSSAVAAADIDNDGFIDIFLSGDGGIFGDGASPSRLYRNRGDGTFEDITATAGAPGATTALSAAFADIDNDGFVDLFVASPGSLNPASQHSNRLYRNNGDLTFTDVSAAAGLDTARGACAAGFSDFDSDGWMDLVVANCNDVRLLPTPLELHRNRRDGTFEDVAMTQLGQLDGYWMGLAFGDIDNDGDEDLFATNFGIATQHPHALLSNHEGEWSAEFDTTASPWEFSWGATMADFDNDGHLDLYFAGSYPIAPFMIGGPGLANPGRLFFNDGLGAFEQPTVPLPLDYEFTSGLAQADFDGDGFPDLVVVTDESSAPSAMQGRPVLLRNRGNDNHWIGARLVGTSSNRSAIGARVTAIAGATQQLRVVRAGSSLASQDSPWPGFGLGQHDRAELIVDWPSGLRESFGTRAAGQYVQLVEGQGRALPELGPR